MRKYSSKKLEKYCSGLGFDLFGVILPTKSETIKYFQQWLQKKYQANMHWLDKVETREDPSLVLKNCQSIVVLGVSYFNRNYESDEINDINRALIAKYAWGDDYHEILGKKLKQVTAWLTEHYSEIYQHKYYVDTGPILEKELAHQAGLGFIGKNTQLINHKIGSYFFIACLFTQIPFEKLSKKVIGGCGTCNKCINACPTKALIEPHVLNAKRCISYQTIENRGKIPIGVKRKMKNRVFGCDICQEVCPWNKRAQKTKMTELQTKNNRDQIAIEDIRKMDIEKYRLTFKKSAVKRTKLTGLKRNIGE